MRAKVSLKTKTNKRLEKAIKDLKDGSVKVGWINGERYAENGLYVAENAYMQENGFTITHRNGKKTVVLPRPFLAVTMNRESRNWQSFWKKQYKYILEGKILLKIGLNKLGTLVKTGIQKTIMTSDGIRPNKPSTIESKKRKGSPLIPLLDSMRMYKTINYESKVGK